MEVKNLARHRYPTRSRYNKMSKLENKENIAVVKKSADSPLLAPITYGSGSPLPPFKFVTLNQQNENEIGWDFNSPIDMKSQVLFSDKTSPHYQTPKHIKRVSRPKCKKKIVLSEDKSGSDIVNDLAVLNDMVNNQKPEISMTPQPVKGMHDFVYFWQLMKRNCHFKYEPKIFVSFIYLNFIFFL